ncbi:MAG TPA: hypothetical protein GX702_13420 [Chloroflexi bacterium]|jgi:hypothetical protein|nr:hypothetical protein [Chloroflexota bacterium]
MIRTLGALVIIAIIISAVYASAAGLAVSGGTIQAGVSSNLICQPDGDPIDLQWTVGWDSTLGVFTTTQAVVGNIHSDCAGKQMMLVVHTVDEDLVQPAQPIGDIVQGGRGSVTFSFDAIPAKAVKLAHVSIAD